MRPDHARPVELNRPPARPCSRGPLLLGARRRFLPALVLLSALALTGCAPTVSFTGPAFRDLGTTESAYTVLIGVSGGFLGGAQWSAAASHPWIGVSPDRGTGPATVTISIDRNALHPDDQINSGTVTFTSTAGASFTSRLLFRFSHTLPTSIRGRLFPGGSVQSASAAPAAAGAVTALEVRPLAVPPPGPEWVEGEVLVIPRAVDPGALARALGAGDRDVSPAGFVRARTLAGESVPAAVRRLLARGDVAHAQPNFIYRALGPASRWTDDPLFPHQWNLWSTRISCRSGDPCPDAAWLIEGGLATVRVAVVDSGILPAHEEWTGLNANPIVDGHDFVDNDPDPTAIDHGRGDGFHGQFVAGIIGAASNNLRGIAGAARAVSIVPVRVLGSDGIGTTADIAEGIRYAAGLLNRSGRIIPRAQVINLSFGARGTVDPILESAVNAAHASGSVLIAASGNSGNMPVYAPARFTNTIAVGSVDLNNPGTAFFRSSFSSFGPELDLVAPGGTHLGTSGVCVGQPTTIISAWTVPFDYRCWSGTSFATPLVSAVAALMFSVQPALTPNDVRSFLRNHTQNLDRTENTGCTPFSNEIGCGVLDAFRALAAVTGPSAIEVVLQDQAGDPVGLPALVQATGIFEFTGVTGPGPFRVVARQVSGGPEVGRYFQPQLEVLVRPGQSGVNFGIDGALF